MEEILAALAEVGRRLDEQFAQSNPDRLAQTTAHLATVRMCVEALFTETPYRPDEEG
jgi:hypothetical protein